jgi:hypothetical protein
MDRATKNIVKNNIILSFNKILDENTVYKVYKDNRGISTKVYVFDYNKKLINEYKSQSEAGRLLNLATDTISNRIKKGIKKDGIILSLKEKLE